MNKISFTFLFLLLLISCQNENQNSTVKENKIVEKDLSNSNFRKVVLPKLKHETDRKKLTILLNHLDEKHLSLCDFVRREFEIDDSCFAVAKEKYPDPEMQVKFLEVHDNVYEIAHKKFLKQTNFTEHDANFLTIAYSFDENVKNFCGKY